MCNAQHVVFSLGPSVHNMQCGVWTAGSRKVPSSPSSARSCLAIFGATSIQYLCFFSEQQSCSRSLEYALGSSFWSYDLGRLNYINPSAHMRYRSQYVTAWAMILLHQPWCGWRSQDLIAGHKRHCKPVHQSQSQNWATFTSNIWSILWRTNILFFPLNT